MKVFNSEQSKEYVAFTMFFIYLFFFLCIYKPRASYSIINKIYT